MVGWVFISFQPNLTTSHVYLSHDIMMCDATHGKKQVAWLVGEQLIR